MRRLVDSILFLLVAYSVTWPVIRSITYSEDSAVDPAAAVAPLADAAARHDPDALLADARARAVAMPVLLDHGEAALVARALDPSADEASRLSALGALGRSGGQEAETALQRILDRDADPDPIRAAAFRAVRRLQRRQARARRFAEEEARS